MNVIVQAQFWVHIPTKGGHLQTVRASDGYDMMLDRNSGILTLSKKGEPQVIEVSPSAWISIVHAPDAPPPPAPVVAVEEPTKVWTKPPKKK